MAPVVRSHSHSRLAYSLFAVVYNVFPLITRTTKSDGSSHWTKRDNSDKFDRHDPTDIVFVVLIPVLVLLSGLFAGLTLGYMSLDQTQLNVLAISGTPSQRKYATQIMPIRKHGHLLLVTLLLSNMIVNETLPIIADQVLGGGVLSVVISTVLIIIFSEIIPQSLFTRYGLYLGAKMARLTQILIYVMGVVAWPVAKLLDFILGSNHGIIYRRGELKELIALHSSAQSHGGDLKSDTVTIIGATLDLQEKVVSQAMTPISDVFMVSIDASLDFALLKKIVDKGHSRIPIYEEVEAPESLRHTVGVGNTVKKIVGILLVKSCVLLDPKDATPVRNLQLNKVPFVPTNEPLLGILDKFQEGRSHMAIVSRISMDKAKSVKKAVKRGLTQRLRERVGMGDSSSSDSSSSDSEDEVSGSTAINDHGNDTLRGDGVLEKDFAEIGSNEHDKKKKHSRGRSKRKHKNDLEMGENPSLKALKISNLEQSMPADAVLGKEGAHEFLQGFDPAIMPLGIITLEDVLEELIGEEIYDEFDVEGAHGEPIQIGRAHAPAPAAATLTGTATLVNKSVAGVKSLNFFRSRSAPPRERDEVPKQAVGDMATVTESNHGPVQPSHAHIVDHPAMTPGTSPDMDNFPDMPITLSAPAPMYPSNSLAPPAIGADGKAISIPSPVIVAPTPSVAGDTPQLAAILLERKRRNVTAVPAGAASPRLRVGPKGIFKSAPIDVNVARNIDSHSAPVSPSLKPSDDDRIPHEKDKEGPDIKEL